MASPVQRPNSLDIVQQAMEMNEIKPSPQDKVSTIFLYNAKYALCFYCLRNEFVTLTFKCVLVLMIVFCVL